MEKTSDEKRKALEKFCQENVLCDNCILGGNAHRCGRGAFFNRSEEEDGYMTDKEIDAAYKTVFLTGADGAEGEDGEMDIRDVIFREITETMADVHARKNHDYGNSFTILRGRYPNAILIRLFDKLNRLDTLMSGTSARVDESIDDTLVDLANYAVMELVERRIEAGNGYAKKREG